MILAERTIIKALLYFGAMNTRLMSEKLAQRGIKMSAEEVDHLVVGMLERKLLRVATGYPENDPHYLSTRTGEVMA